MEEAAPEKPTGHLSLEVRKPGLVGSQPCSVGLGRSLTLSESWFPSSLRKDLVRTHRVGKMVPGSFESGLSHASVCAGRALGQARGGESRPVVLSL